MGRLGTNKTNESGGVFIADSKLEIARGGMSGMKPLLQVGRNDNIDTATTPEDITDIGGIYVPPTQARIHDIVSTSTQDSGILRSGGTLTSVSISESTDPYIMTDSTATFITDSVAVGDVVLDDTNQDHSIVITVDSETQLTIATPHHGEGFDIGDTYRIVGSNGTGAVVAHIKLGLLSARTEKSEFVILNGTTNVSTTNAFYRINRMHIHGSGSSKSNLGDITATAQTDATVTAKVIAGNGQTEMAFFSIPKGKKGYITSIWAGMNRQGGVSGAMANLSLYENLWANRSGGDGENIFVTLGLSIEGGPVTRSYNPYLVMSEYSDVWLRCQSVTDNNTDISAGFDMILVNK